VHVESARERLRAAVKHYEPQGGLDDVVRAGITAEEIVRLVGEIEADLVVVGVGGTHAVGSRRPGSTTTRLLRRLPCALLAVGISEKEESGRA
jgi:nucleotide-binding universal stress UspA family protein